MLAPDLQEQLDAALRLVADLRRENALLRGQLASLTLEDTAESSLEDGVGVTGGSPPDAKIALFRSLFRGRDDVYAERWENRDGRAGYSPVLRPGVRRVRGEPPPDGACMPLDDGIIRAHLQGRTTLGVYPLLRDETTWFLALDFDKSTWRDDVRVARDTCHALGIPVAVECSRSGNGAHLWVFFAEPVSAALARTLGCVVLTQTMDRRPDMGFDSYDRLFPSQDTMPKGGFGNLIALPLQGASKRSDKTVFLGADLRPYRDQWQYLSTVPRMTASAVEGAVRDAAARGRVMGVGADWLEEDDNDGRPWELPPSRRRAREDLISGLPGEIEVVDSGRLFISTTDLPAEFVTRLRRLAAFQNPEFYRAQRMRMSTWGKPRVVSCSESFPQHVALPRGCRESLIELIHAHGTRAVFVDERENGVPIVATFAGSLTSGQHSAAKAVVRDDIGVLSAPTAFGKTVVGAWIIAKRGVNTLVLVHRRHLLDQWREQLAAFLDIPVSSVGQIGGGKRRPTGTIDVALLPTLCRKGVVDDVVSRYGHIVVDECHHIPAFSFEKVLAEARARYITGLTATPIRKDGHHPIIFMQCGPIRHRIDPRIQAAARPFDHVVVRRPVSCVVGVDWEGSGIQKLFTALLTSEQRTQVIVDDVVRAVADGRSPLILTERTEHLAALAGALEGRVQHVIEMRGGMGIKQRRAIADRLANIPDDESRVIVATGRYVGEGFDDHRLDTLFLAMPVAWRGTIQQYAGRLHRLHDRKRVVTIYDYVDVNIPVLERMFEKRLRGYSAIGYRLVDATPDFSAA